MQWVRILHTSTNTLLVYIQTLDTIDTASAGSIQCFSVSIDTLHAVTE